MSGRACLVANADDLANQAAALELIVNTADRICNMVRTEGSAQELEISGDIKAELSGLVRKLVDVGVSGTGKFSTEKFENVLRTDLAKSLKDNAECKLKVFESLQEKLIASPKE